MKRIAYLLVGLVCFSLLSVVAVNGPSSSAPDPEATDRLANLVLRQIGHELLLCQGDADAPLPPVTERSPGHYVLATRRYLDYGNVLEISAEVIRQSGWTGTYSLALEDCVSSLIVLGFHSALTGSGNQAACMDREQESDACYNLSLVLPQEPPAAGQNLLVAGLSLTGVFTTALFFLLPLIKREKKGPVDATHPVAQTTKQLSPQTVFTPGLQSLSVAGKTVELTYREAKLLDYLTDHPHEVLERGTIHAAVWGTDGIMVSRSLDVFISRLRKKLSGDASLEIATIHGIGYRLLLQRSC